MFQKIKKQRERHDGRERERGGKWGRRERRRRTSQWADRQGKEGPSRWGRRNDSRAVNAMEGRGEDATGTKGNNREKEKQGRGDLKAISVLGNVNMLQ